MERDGELPGIPRLPSHVRQQQTSATRSRLLPRRQKSDESTSSDEEGGWFNPAGASCCDGNVAKPRYRINEPMRRRHAHKGDRSSDHDDASLSEPLHATPSNDVVRSPVSVGHDTHKTNLPPILEKSIVSVDHDLREPYINASRYAEAAASSRQTISASSAPENVAEKGEYNKEGGLVILDESPASRVSPADESISFEADIGHASMYDQDSIVLAAAARVNANLLLPKDEGEASLVDFEQLLREAGDRGNSSRMSTGECFDVAEGESEDDESMAAATPSEESSWWYLRNPLGAFSRKKSPDRNRAPPSQHFLHTPVRATRISDDTFVVEIEIYPSQTQSTLGERDVMDIMANIELLHLWFDPVPAVFDAAVKDGSGSDRMISPRTALENSLEEGRANDRQQDGQWVEISTPLLSIPSDSQVARCVRTVRVALRAIIGFPARMRSMIFVERASGRMGMTLGPYPDGFLCGKGMMAYHAFEIRVSDEETVAANGRRCVVISDEVRLKRGGDDFDEARRTGCVWSIFLFLMGALKWALCFRLYKPDLPSYMQQSVSSLERLRNLVERGESAAYAGAELIADSSDGSDNATDSLSMPLLGQATE
ncbi:hypothetical protein ACHAXT_011154 [Thalassiosira profunda]